MPIGKKDLKATHEIIYAGKVAHISMDSNGEPVGVVIQNEEIYNMQRLFLSILGVNYKQSGLQKTTEVYFRSFP